jgi:hypothetical protein
MTDEIATFMSKWVLRASGKNRLPRKGCCAIAMTKKQSKGVYRKAENLSSQNAIKRASDDRRPNIKKNF